MVSSFTLRALIATALLASLVVQGHGAVTAAQPDSAAPITLTTSGTDRVTSFGATPPAGFAAIGFNDSGWSPASDSPCADPAWELPPGVDAWEWAGTCTYPNINILLRRSFALPAPTALTARLWVSVHGGGLVFVNGHQVAQSIGNPALVDVTALVRGNGAKNVLAIGALEGQNGGGIAYALQITISKNQEKAFLRAHRTFRLPQQFPLLTPGAPAPVGATTPQSVPSSTATCGSALSSSVFAVSTDQTNRLQPVSTGWVYQNSTPFQSNQLFPYLATRQIDLSAIASAPDMPSVMIAGQTVHAVAIADDTQSGAEVMVLPSFTASSVTPVTVSLAKVHNQPVGDPVQLTAYSRARGCLASSTPTVVSYQRDALGNQLAQLDSVLYNDGADGGIAQDQQGVLLGEIAFVSSITTAQGQPVPLIAPI
ncbi:MAG TPA: hypothetical protein VHB98_16010, partial [Chloroflexota bacterium]|nr:hypothetical protein [Chloroflexota bacterium]